jgi:hypothetical protein
MRGKLRAAMMEPSTRASFSDTGAAPIVFTLPSR